MEFNVACHLVVESIPRILICQIRIPALEPVALLHQIAGILGLCAMIHLLRGRLNAVPLFVKGHIVLIDAPLGVERDVRRHRVWILLV